MSADRTYEEVIAAWGDSSDGRTEEAWLWDEVLAAREQRDHAARLAGSLELALTDAERARNIAIGSETALAHEVERLRAREASWRESLQMATGPDSPLPPLARDVIRGFFVMLEVTSG